MRNKFSIAVTVAAVAVVAFIAGTMFSQATAQLANPQPEGAKQPPVCLGVVSEQWSGMEGKIFSLTYAVYLTADGKYHKELVQ